MIEPPPEKRGESANLWQSLRLQNILRGDGKVEMTSTDKYRDRLVLKGVALLTKTAADLDMTDREAMNALQALTCRAKARMRPYLEKIEARDRALEAVRLSRLQRKQEIEHKRQELAQRRERADIESRQAALREKIEKRKAQIAADPTLCAAMAQKIVAVLNAHDIKVYSSRLVGRVWGDVWYHELDGMRREGLFQATVAAEIQAHTTPTKPIRIRDIVSNAELDKIMLRAARVSATPLKLQIRVNVALYAALGRSDCDSDDEANIYELMDAYDVSRVAELVEIGVSK